MTGERRDRQSPAHYQVRVRGHLGPTTLRAFPALHAEVRGRDTLLQGPVADQAALHGVLDRIEELGLELLEVRRLGCRVAPEAGANNIDGPPMLPGRHEWDFHAVSGRVSRPRTPALPFAESATDI